MTRCSRILVSLTVALAACPSDGSQVQQAYVPWAPESQIEVGACHLDLDCNGGSFCSLGICVSDCRGDSDCAGQICGDRGRCLERGTRELMTPPPLQRLGALSVTPNVLFFGPDEDSRTLNITVTGLGAGEVFRYRLAAANDLVWFDEIHQYRSLAASAEGTVQLGADVILQPDQIERHDGHGRISVITQSGTLEVPILIVTGAAVGGRYQATLTASHPVSHASVPVTFDVWPSADASEQLWVEILPENNLLFDRGLVVGGRFDPERRNLSFELLTVLKPEVWETASLGDYRADPGLGGTVDFSGLDISPSLTWDRLSDDSFGNPFRRYVGRQIQVSLTLEDDGVFRGDWTERIHGLSDTPIDIAGQLTAKRHIDLDELKTERGASYAPRPPTFPLAAIEMPRFHPATDARSVATSCQGVVIPNLPAELDCGTLTDSTNPGTLVACADAAVMASTPFGASYDPSTQGGAAFEGAYVQCVGLTTMTEPTAVPPVFASGCYDENLLRCARAAYDRATHAAGIQSLRLSAFRRAFQTRAVASLIYGFLSQEYASQAVYAAATDATGGIHAESEALDYSANAAYLSAAVLMQPEPLHWLRVAPDELSGIGDADDSVAAIVGDEYRRRWDVLTLALTRFDEAMAMRQRVDPLAGGSDPAQTADAKLYRTLALSHWIQAGVLGADATARLGTEVGTSAEVRLFRSAYQRVINRWQRYTSGQNALGLDPGMVPIVGERENGDTRTNFRILLEAADEATGSDSDVQITWDGYLTTVNHWNRSTETLVELLERRLDAMEDNIADLCGSLPIPEHPAWVEGQIQVPEPDALAQYRLDIAAYPEQCVENTTGALPSAVLDIANAVLDAQVADAQIAQIHALVQIKEQFVERVTGVRNKYLQFRLSDGAELGALQMRSFDLQEQALKDKRAIEREGAVWQTASGLADAMPPKKNPGKIGKALVDGAWAYRKAGLEYDAAKNLLDGQRQIAQDERRVKRRMTMHATQEANELEVATAQAAVKELLTQSATLLLQREQAGLRVTQANLALNTMIFSLSDELESRDTLIERRLSDPNNALNDPLFRVIRDENANAYRQAFTRAQKKVYYALRALEYETGWDSGLEQVLFAANSPLELRQVVQSIDDAYDCFTMRAGDRAPYELEISLRRDIFGIEGPWQDPLTGEVFTEGDRFRRTLLSPDTLITTTGHESLTLVFSTGLSINEVTGFTVSSLTRCVEQIDTIQMQVVGSGVGTDHVEIFLDQRGTGLLRSCESSVGLDPEGDELRSYDLGAGGINTGTSIQARVNDWSDPNGQLASRPVANTRWELYILLSDPQHDGLNLLGIEDILLRITTGARSLPPGGTDLSTCFGGGQ